MIGVDEIAAISSTLCLAAGFDFNLLYTVGRRDRLTLQGRLLGFFGIHLINLVDSARATRPEARCEWTKRSKVQTVPNLFP